MGINQKTLALGSKRSIIREIFEYSKTRASEIGAENVYDFSLGNPSVPAPAEVNETIKELLDSESSLLLHGYTSAQGDANVRRVISDSIMDRFGVEVSPNFIYMTCGAAASLSICLKAVIEEGMGDECIVFAPFFTEYRVFIENAGGKVVVSNPRESDLQIDIEDFASRITKNTKCVIINSPNNPSGVVYNTETVMAVCDIIARKSMEYGRDIYLIADEPYRELVYTEVEVPYLMKYYKNTLVCYSYSKSLSLPGERIGYVLVPKQAADHDALYAAVAGASRSHGHVCAPSLWQKVIARCAHLRPDLNAYDRNRRMLYDALTEMGYEMAKPDGAFYLFIKAPGGDAVAFSEKAKQQDLLLVPGDGFGCPGYFRICYCVSLEMIQKSLPVFQKLINE